MSRKPRVLSPPAAAILQRFMRAPADELYGFEIIRETGIASSTLYPALRVLAEERGFLSSRWEAIDPAKEGRPPRRMYRLNGHARQAANEALREHAEHHKRRLKPVPLRPRHAER